MIRRLADLAGSLMGHVLTRIRRARVGTGSRVDWWRIRSLRHGSIQIGSGSMVRCRVDFDGAGGTVQIGDRSYVGASHLVCHSRIGIGSDVLISWGVTVIDHDSHSLHWQQRAQDVSRWMQGKKDWTHVNTAPVEIADKAWIGYGATILKGVTIGEGAVVAACSVVTRSIPPYTLAAGNPARVLRSLQVADADQASAGGAAVPGASVELLSGSQ